MWFYGKGSRVEREIMDYFAKHGFCAIRAAGSGVSSKSPDMMVFKKGKQYAFESKAHEGLNLQVKRDQIELLKHWYDVAQVTPFVVWKRKGCEPLFIPINVLKENRSSFTISLEAAERLAYKKEDLVYGR